VIHPNAPGAQCPDSASINFTVTFCPGQILGAVLSVDSVPIVNANVKLFADANADGVADNTTVLKNAFTSGTGGYFMAAITPGHYVIVQTQPNGWISVDDGNPLDTNDVVPNLDPTDNLIPVTILPSEVDTFNNFIEIGAPGNIAGFVFNDFDSDNIPDPAEGLSGVTVKLFSDNNTNGIADNDIPIATQITNSNGAYTFNNLPVGHYVIVEDQPTNYTSLQDIDFTPDGDVVPNSNMMDDTIPVSLTNGETDAQNFFKEIPICALLVTNTNDAGSGSLRNAINCGVNGDTIRFHPVLSGLTIGINSSVLQLNEQLVIMSEISPTVTISSQINGLFDIQPGGDVEFHNLKIISGLSPGNTGAAFENFGILKLNDCQVLRNPLFTSGEYLIRNNPGSLLLISGICFIETD
jgi:hypothetical protein